MWITEAPFTEFYRMTILKILINLWGKHLQLSSFFGKNMSLGSQKFPKKWTLSMTLAEISSALHKQVNKKKNGKIASTHQHWTLNLFVH